MKKKRNTLEWIALIVALLCIIGAGSLTVAYGFTIGNAITFAIASVLIVLGLWMRKMPRWIQRCITVVIVVGLVFFFTITGVVVYHGTHDTVDFKEDCVLVLGCGIRGEIVLPTLESRLNQCLEYLKRNPKAIVIVSGGRGHNEDITEAEAMMRYLCTHGVPEQQIIKEEKSRNTIENFTYSKVILDSLFPGRNYVVAAISSDYHAYRVRLVASDVGVVSHSYSAGVKWYLRPSAYSREALSVCRYWMIR